MLSVAGHSGLKFTVALALSTGTVLAVRGGGGSRKVRVDEQGSVIAVGSRTGG
jgi:hypothetical protein